MQLFNSFRRLMDWESWHYHVKYVPLYPFWFWYCLKARSLWWFTPSNPTITFGGFEGEPKSEMYQQLPQYTYPKSIYIRAGTDFSTVKQMLVDNSFEFPFAVKPDAGMMGFLFRKIDSIGQLHDYHQKLPVDYIVQDLITYPMEVSVFYYRHPSSQKGTITGFLKKELLEVTGDGRRTLQELILDFPDRPGYKPSEWLAKYKDTLQQIIPSGEVFRLSWAANLSRGGRLISLEHEKDESLLIVFDELSNYAKHFYYGRYDIKCSSIEELKQGRNYSILEYNGCGAEPHHIYGNKNSVWKAYRIILQHWKVLYQISTYNHKQGIPFWSFKKGLNYLKAAKRHMRMLKKLDQEAS